MNIYMDYNARAPLRPEAANAMHNAMALHGNPSSPHREGRAARAIIDEARECIAALCHAGAENVIFTSGGTEANALAMHICATWNAPSFVSAVEHVSLLDNAPRGHHVIPVDESGRVAPEQIAQMIKNTKKPFVSVMLANNETGIIQPIAEIAAIVKEQGGFMHCDAAQAAGKINLNMKTLGVDALSLSAHKMGGPPGIGALVLAGDHNFAPLIKGGGQELGQRAGTENLIAIAGFASGFAAAAKMVDRFAALASLRDALEDSLPDNSIIFSQTAPRLPNTSCFALPGLTSQAALIMFDLAGICLSAGSACSSGKIAPSHVLLAQNIRAELAACALRVSLGWQTSAEHILHFTKTVRTIGAQQAA